MDPSKFPQRTQCHGKVIMGNSRLIKSKETSLVVGYFLDKPITYEADMGGSWVESHTGLHETLSEGEEGWKGGEGVRDRQTDT